MIKKTDLLIGFIIGIIACFLGMFLYITIAMHTDFLKGIQIMKSEGHLGKIVALGSILDLIAFGILLKMNKELIARGVVLSVIILTIITLFI
ncbi:hypothetical protein [Flavobacterium gilvum]|uniref:Uncharacterized protein n=1 Tax=Flavobacterium gilvum TaxID=1492737 RepID=A0AAC9N4J8_9FLAO|nr:hypothetical protein [Flavobacterium gilvum]AOW08381.1 hypothetical protein EM308_02035 [Flavobacterium gilvum]KFC59672.1 hypothetical protein FEM08_15440 [Flavobacterium gilvum]